MATEFAVFLPQGSPTSHVDRVLGILEQLESLERMMTIYNPHSELSQVNRAAGLAAVRVSPPLLEVLQISQQLAAETDGAFDVTAGPLIDAWGFTQRSGRRPTEAALADALAKVGWQKMEIDPERSTVRLAEPGMKLNLGAIGKGYALDCICRDLELAGVENFLAHGGHSSVVARGSALPVGEIAAASTGCTEERTTVGWRVGVQHPLLPQRRLGGITLVNQALGTSGSGKQHFHYQGRRLGHVIDPRSGRPAGDWLSLTVVDDSAAKADALATALFVRGKDAVAQRAKENPGEGWVAVFAGERQAEVAVQSWNLSQWVALDERFKGSRRSSLN